MPDKSQREQFLLQKRRRQALVFLNASAVFFFIGPVLGWGPMQLLLEENGAYSTKCNEEDREDGVVCSAQTSRLVKIGLSISMTQMAAPFIGFAIDKCGPKLSAYFQAFVGICGLSVIVVATVADIDILLNVGFVTLSTHTWAGVMLIVQLGLYFHGHTTSRVIFILNTLFDAGTLIYLLLWGIGQAPGLSATTVLSGYLVFGLVIYGTSTYYWAVAIPETDDTEKSNRSVDSPTAGSKSDGIWPSTQCIVESDQFQSSACESTHELDLIGSDTVKNMSRRKKQKISSIAFSLLCIFYGLQVATSNWNLATQRDFLAGLGDDERDNLYLTIFTLLTPVSILGNPFIDWVLLRFEWTTALQVINLLSICFQVVKVSSRNLNVQVLGFILYSFYRAFLYGVSFSFLPWLIEGPLVGRATGIMIGCAGISTLLLIPIVDMAVNQGDGNFQTANLVMLGLAAPNILVVCFVTPYTAKSDPR